MIENKNLSDKDLEQVTGGSWGFEPGSPCPYCRTPLVENGKADTDKGESKCPGCGEWFVYGLD